MSASDPEILSSIQAAFDAALPTAKRTLALDDDLLDLGIGSVAALEMATSLEARYRIHLAEERLAELRSVRDFAELVASMVNAPRPE